ncbi:MAG: TIR domain-containing protein [Cyanobacteria bacterium K_Offshore_surface_m2_239]|nr:TIR domain-containing protein [Cyanobacteria bacterium K_Offshore_surface_m2_239]
MASLPQSTQQHQPLPRVPQPACERRHVFISYSHADRAWVERIRLVMAPLLRQEGNSLQLWDDSQIEPGSKWQAEIETALARAQVALLLVSADFLASEFVMGKEVPALLRAADAEGVTILWVPLSACLVRHTPIHAYQAVLAPEHTLDAMEPHQQRHALVRIAEAVHDALRQAEERARRRELEEQQARQRLELQERQAAAAAERQRAEEAARSRQQERLAAEAAERQRQQQLAADRALQDQVRRQQLSEQRQRAATERAQTRKAPSASGGASGGEGGGLAWQPNLPGWFTRPEPPQLPRLSRRQLLVIAAAVPLAAVGIGRVRQGSREAVNRGSLALPASLPPSAIDVNHGWLERQAGGWQVRSRSISVQAVDQPLGNGSTLRMIVVPAGRFRMGSPASEPERSEAEGPQHEVRLASFRFSQAPITQAQWRAVMQTNPSHFRDKPDSDQRPVEQVSWPEAMEFCKRLSQRTGRHYTLPSEAQWEYACRAGSTTPFAFGATITTDLANYDGNYTYSDGPKGVYREQTTPVGMFAANAWGLQDMHGNVWEWCLDHWHASYAGAPADGTAWVDSEAEKSGADRLLRGGSWFDGPRFCRSAHRFHGLPGNAHYDVGFRVVCLPQDPSLNF